MPVILVNQTLSQLLRCVVGKNLKTWEECLPHAEFTYNRVVNSITSYSPFEVVYGSIVRCPFLICYLCLTLFLWWIGMDFLKTILLRFSMRRWKHKLRKRLNNMLDIPIRGERKWFPNRVIGFQFTWGRIDLLPKGNINFK